MKILLANGFIALCVVFSGGCRSAPSTNGEQNRRLTLEEFVLLDWQRQSRGRTLLGGPKEAATASLGRGGVSGPTLLGLAPQWGGGL